MIKDNLPLHLSEEKYTKEILEAIEPELDNLKSYLAKLLLETCITTCTQNGMKHFENDYSIPVDLKLSLNERRKRVINKMLAKKTLTKDRLNDLIWRNINFTQFYISNHIDQYEFQVMLVDEFYKDELYNILYAARPAHLVFNIKMVKAEKRCGSFFTGINI